MHIVDDGDITLPGWTAFQVVWIVSGDISNAEKERRQNSAGTNLNNSSELSPCYLKMLPCQI